MDLIDRLRALATRAEQQLPHLATEEATKTALVMPFINALGYDVFNPLEVVPEFTADVGVKKAEKVDYAIMRDGEPIMLFECKKAGTQLEQAHASQLFRYFTVTPVRIGVLTNGTLYQFYSDLEQPNKMDSRPFLEFDLLSFDESMVHELKRLSRSSFDLAEMLGAAEELKYTRAIKQFLSDQLHAPSEDFVRFLAAQVYSGVKTQAVVEKFTGITRRALHSFINDRISDRLKAALGNEGAEDTAPDEGTSPDAAPDARNETESQNADRGIVTTQEERDAYLIVKAIVTEVVDPKRVVMRDTKSYCGILLDDNNRKPICRLHFNYKSKRYLGVFDRDRRETRIQIAGPEQIFLHASALKDRVRWYLEGEQGEQDV